MTGQGDIPGMINRAANLQQEDWALIMEITDTINLADNGPAEAVSAIQLLLGSDNDLVCLQTLTILESCVQNCGPRFHRRMAKSEFMEAMAIVAAKKSAAGEDARKLLGTWVIALSEYPVFRETYGFLKAQGLEFPAIDASSVAPINLPPVVDVPERPPHRTSTGNGGGMAPQSRRLNSSTSTHTAHTNSVGWSEARIKPSNEQILKIRGDLEVVRGNLRGLEWLLRSHQPGTIPSQLLQDVYRTSRAMQERLVVLIAQVDHPDLTRELLSVNDQLVFAFGQFKELVKRPLQRQQQQRGPEPAPLIDLSSQSNVSVPMASLSLNDQPDQPRPPTRAPAPPLPPRSETTESVTKDEFEEFLQQRESATTAARPPTRPLPPAPNQSTNNTRPGPA
eukprot:comp18535_c0_seq1/m.19967 comp18535_c0_seq1/g.19967  ORF comp18535_c0_seq1/g.19967 comp18535_c0_seq1/m.19967 type:complete len:393 (-) comp18535_c0_seq1:163-1341(-)